MIFRSCVMLLLAIVLLPAAETIRLSGTVTDEDDDIVEGAVVTLHSRDSLGTRTDETGYFELTDKSLVAIARQAENGMRKNESKGYGTRYTADSRDILSIYEFNGRLLLKRAGINDRSAVGQLSAITDAFSPGVYLITISGEDGFETVFRYVHRGKDFRPGILQTGALVEQRRSIHSSGVKAADFSDILVVAADGMQTLRRAVVNAREDDILIKLMPRGVNYVTPGIPLYSDEGGIGDVTTYGSVSNPEVSQGGACNYGSMGIRYYAAINVNQIPGDARGQWNDGRCCGRCARVRVRTSDGEVRTTVVRIVDKCPDDNCGIDLGGAPAGEVMGNQPGRYSGEWEWVNCDEFDGVSDGPASIYTKEGTNEWWSLVQVRNGAGGVADIRIRKTNADTWISLEWATEAENFFKVPQEMLQDADEWKIEVLWDNGSTGELVIPGNQLAIEDTSYQLTVSK